MKNRPIAFFFENSLERKFVLPLWFSQMLAGSSRTADRSHSNQANEKRKNIEKKYTSVINVPKNLIQFF